MVQEFKDYDKVYSKYKGKLMDYEDCLDFKLEEAKYFDAWGKIDKRYTNAEIRQAVYFDAGAEEWQKFRVSLKGFSTREKLYRLNYRLEYFKDKADFLLQELRVINYIGALVRGGQLDTKLNVVR